MKTLASDSEYQLRFVAENAWRLLAMQDVNPISPTHGCFHYAYWRDKTSDFPDSRFQEAGATLGLLSLPQFDHLRDEGLLPPAAELYRGFNSGLRCLSKQQYPEGCYDEWYKGERGFAVTEFTTAAYGLAACFLGERLGETERQLLEPTLTRAADWLSNREDVVKINHEAVATVSLAAVGKIVGDQRYLEAARKKLDITLAHQTSEGWFPELRGMDLGYSSLILDYLMIYSHLTSDETAIPGMVKLLKFMLPHLHPDFTISPEGGTCQNAYVGRIGLTLLAQYDDTARAIVSRLDASANRRAGVATYLADDLRLARWGCLPVIGELLPNSLPAETPLPPISAELYPEGWTYHREACLCAWHGGDTHVYFVAVGGGITRCFYGVRLAVEDLGYDVVEDRNAVTSRVFEPMRSVHLDGERAQIDVQFARPRFLSPGFLSRLVLRAGSTTAFTSRLLRKAIDVYRTRKKTAINQAATSVGERSSGITMNRSVSVSGDSVTIADTLRCRNNSLDSDKLQTHLRVDGTTTRVLAQPFSGESTVRITKRFKTNHLRTEAVIDVEVV